MPEALVVGEIVPQLPSLQAAPERIQSTPLFWESLVTVAVKVWVPPAGTLAEVGDIATVMSGEDVTVMVAEADLVASATEVAVRVTALDGAVAGAV
jgi:hypothetical protein